MKTKPTKAKLVAELKRIVKEHGLKDIKRDFYREASEYQTDAFTKFFPGGWKEFRAEAGLAPAETGTSPAPAPVKVEMPIEKQVELEKERITSKATAWKAKFEHLAKEHAELENELQAILSIKDKTPQEHFIKAKTPSGTSESVAIMVGSDWHAEERVLPGDVSGVNEYNPDIAQKRADRFFQGGQRLWSINNRDTRISTIVIALLGDMISNTLHEDQQESNFLLPADAIYFAQNLIYSGIKFMLRETDADLLIPCHTGNHGRMTKKQRKGGSTEIGNSLEQYMYYNLRDLFRDEPRVKFQISTGYHSYTTLFDRYTIRWHHGHSINYGGGVGGITIPVNKAIAQWNKTRNVDLDIFGHFHTYIDAQNFISNGSLIGHNGYAVSIKADYQTPKQAFALINREYNEKSIVTPIFVGDKVRPE